MLTKTVKYVLLFWCSLFVNVINAQETDCDPTANLPITQGEVDFNYGSVTNSFSFRNRSSYTVAQSVIGNNVAKDFSAQSGFWSRFLLPPQAPQIQSSQGEFPDRVLINWNLDPLSSDASNGYVVTRDGAFLAQVDRGITQFIDFNVQPGEFYEYGVYGRNQFGNGTQGKDIGFVNPNGVVTGRVETFSRNPVAGAIVTLTPSIGNSMLFDGINDYLCVTHKPIVPTNMWTASAWVKIDAGYNSDGIVDLGSDLNKNFFIHTTPSSLGKGVVAGIGNGTSNFTLTHEFSTDPDGWHHVAAVYAGGSLLLYVDGTFVSSGQSAISNEAALFTIGSRRNQTGFFHGKIDDVRLYSRPLTGSEIFLTNKITVSKSTPGLTAYWKFDEGLGTRVFDISANKMHAYINGPQFSSDTPSIQNAGISDVGGFYAIEGVNYSQEQTFTATPSKIFYSNYALEFNSAYQSHVTLTSFDLPDSATVEVTIQPFDIQSRQTVLNNGNGDFELWIESGQLKLTLNGQTQNLGLLTKSYQHISLTLKANQVKYYKNGDLINTLNYTNINGNWDSNNWQLGARNAGPTDFFTGLIDEVAFYKDDLSQADIQLNASTLPAGGTNAGHPDLLSYFSLDEAVGTEVEDTGPAMTGFGEVSDAFFSVITYKQSESPHSFRPSQRLVNINESNTAASGIDFVDESTLTVKGVVRFSNTFCYQDSVEIYVNGAPAFPPIYTNEEGRFVADFEPGSTVKLSPKFGDHVFSPSFYEVKRLNRPIAGVLFQNLTKREVSGQLTGGLCRQSIIPENAYAIMKVEALNLCYLRYDTIRIQNGNFKFTNVPPIPVRVALTYHPNNTIFMWLNDQGAPEIDLRNVEKDTVDFIYIAPPQVYIKPFEENGCVNLPVKLLEQSGPKNNYREYFTDIRVYEQYNDGDINNGRCYLDSFNLNIVNDIADQPAISVTVKDTSTYRFKFFAGIPNLGPPHQKFLQVTADVNGSTATEVETVVVLGERSRLSTFTTSSPAMPLIILRDPPGDKSNAVLTKGTKHCQTWSDGFLVDNTTGTEATFDLGPTITTYSGSPFGGIITQSNVQNEEVLTAGFQSKIGEKNGVQVCVSNEMEFATSSDGVVIGDDADLYVGAAVNFEFSATDILAFDPLTCTYPITQSIRVNPKSFGTNYIYSEYQIENDVIPSNELIGDTVSADAWRKILQHNKDLKKNAAFKKNISFDALTNYSESFGTSSTNSFEFSYDLIWNASYNTTLGFDVMGVGTKVKIGHKMEHTTSNTNGSNDETNRLVKFTLGDDDLGDNFTVDVLDDAVFGTPVFKLKAGESMCPWESGTLNREEVGFSIDRVNAPNVPENDGALFKSVLSNKGQTGNDLLVYQMGVVPGSNPDFAFIYLEGGNNVQLGPFQSKEIPIAIYKGPTAYNYYNLGVFAASTCQLEHSLAYGYDLAANNKLPKSPNTGPYKTADLDKFYKEYRLNVEFTEPCSPIDVTFPMQDWVITPANNEELSITLNNYIYNDPDLELVRVQYRRTGGDGTWTNIVELPKSAFASDPVFKIVTWDMSLLADGPYEVRAITQCFDVSLPRGISEVIKGRKETQAPELFGVPEPADGVLSPGDEISVTFSKRILCDSIFQADGIGTNINLNNLALLDMTDGGILIDAIFTCKDDKIVIVPAIQNQFIENHVLRVVATDIKDLYNNEADQVVWEFYVNRSNLYWHGGGIDEIVYEGNEMIVTREIRNQSGQRTTFEIKAYPNWMEVFPLEGGLDPGGIMQVRFVFPSNLVNGFYNTTINMTTVDGEEPLDVKLRVACEAPIWNFNPNDYSYSMNLTLQPNIEGTLSKDRLDLVGAFVNGELRGVGKVQYFNDLDKHLVFLTVFSNNNDEFNKDTITFQIWDASACLIYGETVEKFEFYADSLFGTPLIPVVIYTNNMVLRKVQIHPGWNWLSYNINLPDPSINVALATLTKPQGNRINNQTTFSDYSTVFNTWLGNLLNLSHLTMYQLDAVDFDSISFVGTPIDPTTPMPLLKGWNWIGYLPQYGLPINQALNSLNPLNGDIIKSQLQFAQYVAGVGWIGNLGFLSSPNGYMIKLSNNGTLSYPGPEGNIQNSDYSDRPYLNLYDQNKTDLDRIMPLNENLSKWTVNPQLYEFNMNMIAIVSPDDQIANLIGENDEIGVFVGNELRGSGKALYIPVMDKYMVFITVYANKAGEILNFKWYDASENKEMDLKEKTGFIINGIWGRADNPSILHLNSTSSTADADVNNAFTLYPNPTANHLYIELESEIAEEIIIKVTDVLGKEIRSLRHQVSSGNNIIEWNQLNDMDAGVYWLKLANSKGESYQKFIIIR